MTSQMSMFVKTLEYPAIAEFKTSITGLLSSEWPRWIIDWVWIVSSAPSTRTALSWI